MSDFSVSGRIHCSRMKIGVARFKFLETNPIERACRQPFQQDRKTAANAANIDSAIFIDL